MALGTTLKRNDRTARSATSAATPPWATIGAARRAAASSSSTSRRRGGFRHFDGYFESFGDQILTRHVLSIYHSFVDLSCLILDDRNGDDDNIAGGGASGAAVTRLGVVDYDHQRWPPAESEGAVLEHSGDVLDRESGVGSQTIMIDLCALEECVVHSTMSCRRRRHIVIVVVVVVFLSVSSTSRASVIAIVVVVVVVVFISHRFHRPRPPSPSPRARVVGWVLWRVMTGGGGGGGGRATAALPYKRTPPPPFPRARTDCCSLACVDPSTRHAIRTAHAAKAAAITAAALEEAIKVGGVRGKVPKKPPKLAPGELPAAAAAAAAIADSPPAPPTVVLVLSTLGVGASLLARRAAFSFAQGRRRLHLSEW